MKSIKNEEKRILPGKVCEASLIYRGGYYYV